jgi:hypothetical protein
MLDLFIILKAICEVALFSLLGQGIVALLSGPNRDKNVVYQIFKVITGPPVKLTRLITPRFIIDAHVPFVTFFLFFWLWVGFTYGKVVHTPVPQRPAALSPVQHLLVAEEAHAPAGVQKHDVLPRFEVALTRQVDQTRHRLA